MITKEDKVLIRKLWESKGYGARKLIQKFLIRTGKEEE